jgi:hypothetical protein
VEEERSERTSGWGRELKGGGRSGWNIRGEDSVAFSRGRGCVVGPRQAVRVAWPAGQWGWVGVSWEEEGGACVQAAFSDRWSGEEGELECGARSAEEEWRESERWTAMRVT